MANKTMKKSLIAGAIIGTLVFIVAWAALTRPPAQTETVESPPSGAVAINKTEPEKTDPPGPEKAGIGPAEVKAPETPGAQNQVEGDASGVDARTATNPEPGPASNDGPEVAVVSTGAGEPEDKAREMPPLTPYEDEEKMWEAMLARPQRLQNPESFPYWDCVLVSSSENALPPAVVLALVKLSSNFDPKYTVDEYHGLMKIAWPEPARTLGFDEKVSMLEDPCRNIEAGCIMLRKLFDSSDRQWTPALAAFRKQALSVNPKTLSPDDVKFSAAVRNEVESIMAQGFVKTEKEFFMAFDTKVGAVSMKEHIKKEAGVEMAIAENEYGYVLMLPYQGEEQKAEKLEKIEKYTGLAPQQQ